MFNAADLIIFQLSPGQTCDSHSLYQESKLHRTVQDYHCFQFHANSCLLERTQWIGQSFWSGERKANFPRDDEAWRKSFHLKTLFHLLVAGRNIKLLDFAFPSLLPRSHLNVSSHQRRFKKALRSTKRDYLIPHIVSAMNALSIGERFLPIQFKFALCQHFEWKPENEMKIYFDNAYSTKRWPMECIWQSNGTKVLSKWKVGRE